MNEVQKTKRLLSLFLVFSLVVGLIVPGFAPDVVAETSPLSTPPP